MSPAPEPIAVIGTGCRFPGESTSPSRLWELLKSPRDVLSKIDRFEATSFYHEDGFHHGSSNVRHSYLLTDDTHVFDPQFFSISGNEAESIDPQQRFLLETIFEAVDSAGLTVEGLQGSNTAVYVGVMCDDFSYITYYDNESVPKYAATGTARSILSNRISYFFDWKGPSMTLDTACSSSLVAVHQAVQTLRSGESRVAVAGGTNLIFGPTMYIAESNLSMLSATGRSRMWDADADGYARGEGVAAVVLKTLSNAIADGDHIECLVRETGCNQDGRTPGITMPSAKSQAALIRDTYARAGLNVLKKTDRCQYFEAHGTGTKAGDPQEAEAIHKAFFAEKTEKDEDDVLYVGSIKTIIGHTEGTAGLAGLIKGSLAIQNRTVPSNMHFNTLNPDLKPFYGPLQILKSPMPWPELPEGTPRRVSVNSFGFGGTNAHAIIESYDVGKATPLKKSEALPVTPFVFSAASERSLVANLGSYSNFLKENPDVSLRDLSYTLARKSAFSFRAAFSALTSESLCAKIEAMLEEKKSGGQAIATRPITKGKRVLGVFTGQGAQWPTMGKELILASPYASKKIDELEKSLAELPEGDRPAWSLRAEIMAPAATSRLGEGLLSQPLCTAVQVVLVDLLHAAGLRFDAVVGHSSGEIAAAYTAGFVNAIDAVRIAYYRGLYTKLAAAPSGQNGGMIAAGTSMEDALELCALPKFKGKLQLAASNSGSSVTLSGDISAVKHAAIVFEDEQMFARQLKVDTAYHSHHMIPCSEPYIEALTKCNITINEPSKTTIWYSSVLGGKPVDMGMADILKSGVYWKDNMLKPVLFSQALEAAIGAGAPALAVEVGPHPALKGPASGVIEEAVGSPIPYTGVLARGKNDLEAFVNGLGFLSNYFGPSSIDFKAFDALFTDEAAPELMKDLPPYTWDHERTYWYESRESRMHRLRKDAPHELLGVRIPNDSEGIYRWRNFVKPTEMPWLRGHAIQGQPLYPGAGYAVMAMEAARVLAPAENTYFIELQDLDIKRAMAFPDEQAGVETVCSLTNVREAPDGKSILADFSCDSCMNRDTGVLTATAVCQVVVQLGEPSLKALPEKPPPPVNMRDIDVDHFYSSLASLGYNYSSMFRGITSLQRRTGAAAGNIYIASTIEEPPSFAIHPSTLDVAFQTIFAAFSAPGDGRLYTLEVPTNIKKIRVNMYAVPDGSGLEVELPFEATLSGGDSLGIGGDIDIFDEAGGFAICQIEGFCTMPLSNPTPENDRFIFAKNVWAVQEPDLEVNFTDFVQTDDEQAGSFLAERACLFYLKQLVDTITPEELAACDAHRAKFMEWASYEVELAASGRHSTVKKEWLNDKKEDLIPMLEGMIARGGNFEDLRTFLFVGERLIDFVKGKLLMIQEYREHQLLDHFYRDSYGFPEYNAYLAGAVKQLAHRFPHLNLLEIGAGTGSTTLAVMKDLGQNYLSYTYTDISPAFFEEAADIFKEHTGKFVYKPLDVERDPVTQGFTEGVYDVIIASNVLHATQSLDTTLTHARKLLRPGGYLILFEITNPKPMRASFIFGGIPGWWAGPLAGDDRPLSPLIPQKKWDALFKANGFSGIDTATPESKVFMIPYSIMLTQAIDPQMSLIREPLTPAKKPVADHLVIIGGLTLPTTKLIKEFKTILEPFFGEINVIDSIEEADESICELKPFILSLCELDEDFFNPFTELKFKALQRLMGASKGGIWLNQGCRGEKPYANMMVGVARCLVAEMPLLRLQMFDIDPAEKISPRLVSEQLIRVLISGAWVKYAEPYRPLWAMERELCWVDGRMEIARYSPDAPLNERYNSHRRAVRRDVSLDSTVVALKAQLSGKYDLQEHQSQVFKTEVAEDVVDITVSRSILTALKVKSVGYLYAIAGTIAGTDKKVVGLSETQRSVVSIPKSWTIPYEAAEGEESAILFALANELLASQIISTVASRSALLVHEPTAVLADVLNKRASAKGVQTILTTTKIDHEGVHRFHPSTPDRTIAACLPRNISTFVDLSEDEPNSMASRIKSSLPGTCKYKTSTTYFAKEGSLRATYAADGVSNVLKDAYTQALASFTPGAIEVEELSLKDVSSEQVTYPGLKAVNWASETKTSIKIQTIEKDIKFRDNGTYFMVGLTGELGLSLVEFMVARGAKYFALTSRAPKIDAGWMDMISSYGGVVKTFAMDVTDKPQVIDTVKEIRSTMPPIIGVANGAMVLIDGMFENIEHKEFNKTLVPKVDGSIYLNEIFQEKDLDFFMLFSSLAYVTGNNGQTPYASANAFMTALVTGRRKKGLVGSVMHLAGIFGIGYINRTERGVMVMERLGNMGYANMSEWDFLQFFAEAVNAGPADSGRDPEVGTGLYMSDPDGPSPPAWLAVPRFETYRMVKSAGSGDGGNDKSADSVRAKLAEATSDEAVYDILLEGFTGTLYRQLHMPPEDNEITPERTIVELGVDSLVAVDMRYWFTSELDIDMPVLKILGGATVADLVEYAQQTISVEMTPLLNGGAPADGAAKPEAAKPEVKAKAAAEPASAEVEDSDISSSQILTAPSVTESKAESAATEVTTPPATKEVAKVAEAPKFVRTVKMSYGASRFFFLRNYLTESSQFNLVLRMKFSGKIRERDLARAVEQVGNRHESLRTCFFSDANNMNELTQGVMKKSLLRLEKLQVKDNAEAAKSADDMMNYRFDIENGETARIILLSTSPTDHFLIFAFYHIVMDGVSFKVIISDLNTLYENTKKLPPVRTQYTDFGVNQRIAVESGKLDKEMKFWADMYKDQIPEAIPLFPVAKVKTRQVLETYGFEESMVKVDAETSAFIREQARRCKASAFHFFFAVLKIFIFRHLDTKDMVIAMADANRTDSSFENTVGFILNLLPIRFQANEKETFLDAMNETRTKSYAALANSQLPFDLLLQNLNVPRSTTHSPIFQVFLDYRQQVLAAENVLGATAEPIVGVGVTGYDIVFDIHDYTSFSEIYCRTQKSLYSKEATDLLLNSYIKLLKHFAAAAPSIETSTCELYDPADLKTAAQIGQGPSMTSDWPTTISHRIDDMAIQNPTAVAVKDGLGNFFTYAEMTKHVNSIISALLTAGVAPEDKVAVFQDPSADWVCSLLAIWKVGATYVPLEGRNGLARLSVIVADCKPAAILAHSYTAKDVPALYANDSKIINVSELDNSAEQTIANRAEPEGTAVILYTSGSTGTPKGIVLRHSSIRNEIEGYSKEYEIGAQVVLQQSAYTFDFSLDQMLTGLANGGTLYVVPKDKRGDPVETAKIILNEKITYTKATPSEYASFIRYSSPELSKSSHWKFAFGGGEPFTNALRKDFSTLKLAGLGLFNSYGPGEITIACTKAPIPYLTAAEQTDDVIPCGKALPNYALYIVDKDLALVPAGVTGEVVIGGLGIAKGYLNNETLTKEKFIPDVYTPQTSATAGWTTVYRSGDLGRLLPDGNLVFEGRIGGDTQVKLRGIRIELEDIESSIVQSSAGAIANSVASVRGDPAFLVAHVEFSTSFEGDKDAFLKKLIPRLPLPQYMLPSMMFALDKIPLNDHSKVNRLAIKSLELPEAAQTSDADLTPTEVILKEIWQGLVSKEVARTVAVNESTDFFNFGGNSLLLVGLQVHIREKFNVVLSMMELFETSTLSAQAAKIDNHTAVSAIDWASEITLPADIASSPPTAKSESSASSTSDLGLVVLLTGPTGFLGKSLLKKLDADERISKIICAGVRTPGEQPRELVVKSDKITVYPGNLKAPRIGLTEEQFASLAAEVDVIIHSGADRAFWDYYQELKGSNVDSTKELVRLAAGRKIPIHFLSSGGVLGFVNETNQVSVTSVEPPTDGSNGYLATKWASEAFLENASAKLGVPVYIHRLTPPKDTEAAPSEELLAEFSAMATKLQRLPLEGTWGGSFDLLPVAPLAGEIVNKALDSAAVSTNGTVEAAKPSYLHHDSEVRMYLDDIVKHLQTHEGRDTYERMPPHKWAGMAKTAGISYYFTTVDSTLKAEDGSDLTLKR